MDKNNKKIVPDQRDAENRDALQTPDTTEQQKKEQYLKHPGKIEDYPAQEDVPGSSVAPDNDRKDA